MFGVVITPAHIARKVEEEAEEERDLMAEEAAQEYEGEFVFDIMGPKGLAKSQTYPNGPYEDP